MAIPTAVEEHALALLRILRAHGLSEVCTFNGDIERRDLLNINDLFCGHLTREKS
jgi:xylose isomerase